MLQGSRQLVQRVAQNFSQNSPAKASNRKHEKLEFNIWITYSLLAKARKIWRICLFSLPLDLLVLAIPFTLPDFKYNGVTLLNIAVLLSLIGLIALFRDTVIEQIVNFRRIQARLGKHNDIVAPILAAIAVLCTLGSLIPKFVDAGVLPTVGLVGFILFAIFAFKKHLLDGSEQEKNISTDLAQWGNQLDQQIFNFIFASLICVRLISPFAIVHSVLIGAPLLVPLLFWLVGLLFLLAIYPEQRDLVSHCPSCSRWTSRALTEGASCPECSDRFELTLVNHEGNQANKVGVKVKY